MPSSDHEAVPSTLATIASDLQIKICTLLHPSDIMALRKTCRTLQLITKQRIVWIDVLHRVCLDRTLFLPSYPILDMSDVELERAAMAPQRWIELCAAFEKKQSNDSFTQLKPTTTRIIQDPLYNTTSFMSDTMTFLVPGGRYLVSHSLFGLGVWDLGYTSNTECKLLASIEWSPLSFFYTSMINATSDGMGLIIVVFGRTGCSVYEIYPQSETPRLIQIALLHFNGYDKDGTLAHVSPNRVVWYTCSHGMVFRVWDYRLNHSTSFSVDVDDFRVKAIATKTTVIVLSEEAVLIFGIPPLSPQPPDVSNHSPAQIPSLFRLTFPDEVLSKADLITWTTIYNWYSSSSQSVHFDAFCRDSNLYDFEIVIQPDLSHVSLHIRNIFRLIFHNSGVYNKGRPGEDIILSTIDPNQNKIWIRSISSRSGDVISPEVPKFLNVSLPLPVPQSEVISASVCPVSGRFVQPDIRNLRMVVGHFLP